MNGIACTSLCSIPSADSGSSTTGRSGAFTWASAAGLGRDVIESLEEGACLDGCLQERSRLPDATVTGMLKGARALLLPSLAEGYGLPLAEALTCGAPVLCSDIPLFREVGGGVLDHVDPTMLQPGARPCSTMRCSIPRSVGRTFADWAAGRGQPGNSISPWSTPR